MVLVKILGGIDLVAGLAFLLMIFGVNVFTPYLLFCAALLFIKGLFVFTGEPLSLVDIFSSLSLIIAIFFNLPGFVLWVAAFLLFAKGFVSFL